ncbi:MAG: helix-turn-helix transcriptional regulator [Proteobacteria bacterium]|nr:helix-turn-helix transcriptional regulator [Pseudomonadota bacterium]
MPSERNSAAVAGATDGAAGEPRAELGTGVVEHAGAAAALLKALSNEQRLVILCALLDGPHSVGEINARVPLSQSALSQHLAVLREAGVVRTRRESQTIWYRLAPGPANHIMEALYHAFCAPRPGAPTPGRTRRSKENRPCS